MAGVAFVVALGFGIVIPAISLFADSFGVGKTAVGLTVSAFAFFRFVTAPAGGRLVNRFGERRVLIAGLLTVAATSGPAGFATSFEVFVGLRAIGGVGSAMFTIAALSLLLRVAPPDARARSTATLQGGFLLGGLAGPGLGGVLTDIATWLPFVTYGGLLVVAAAAAAAIPVRDPASGTSERAGTAATAGGGEVVASPATGPATTAPTTTGPATTAPTRAGPATTAPAPATGRLAQVRGLVSHPAFLVALVANLGVGWVLFGVRNSLLTLYVRDIGGTATLAGIVLLLGALAQALTLRVGGRLADRRGRRLAIMLGSWLSAGFVALLAVPLVGPIGLVVAATAMAGFGVGAAFLASAPSAVVGDLGRSGTRVAVFQMSSDLGAIVGPLIAGALVDASGYPAAFALSAVVLAAAGVAALRMPETAPGVPGRRARSGPGGTPEPAGTFPQRG